MKIKDYKTLILLPGQKFKINKQDYQVVQKIFDSPNEIVEPRELSVTYVFRRLPDLKGERWQMSHERLEQLENENKIIFY